MCVIGLSSLGLGAGDTQAESNSLDQLVWLDAAREGSSSPDALTRAASVFSRLSQLFERWPANWRLQVE
jgi:hypothetical protein